jgi:hypothetical protein
VRFPARLFCQGRTLRSRERKLRGLDSADGKAPGTATKGIRFFFFQAEITLEERKKEGNQMPERQHATWGELLQEAVEKPGRMLEAYTAFHNYSFGNALLALEQCTRRNLQPGPLNTYNGWLERKRQVRKGEKGITLCMPMPFKKTAQIDGVQDETAEPQTCHAFRFRAYWFMLAQTEGEDTPIPVIPGFDIDTALCALNITRTPFDELNGNIQGSGENAILLVRLALFYVTVHGFGPKLSVFGPKLDPNWAEFFGVFRWLRGHATSQRGEGFLAERSPENPINHRRNTALSA